MYTSNTLSRKRQVRKTKSFNIHPESIEKLKKMLKNISTLAIIRDVTNPRQVASLEPARFLFSF